MFLLMMGGENENITEVPSSEKTTLGMSKTRTKDGAPRKK